MHTDVSSPEIHIRTNKSVHVRVHEGVFCMKKSKNEGKEQRIP